MKVILSATFLEHINNLSAGATKTYLALSWLKAARRQFSTQHDIATHMNVCLRSVGRYLDELETAGYLERRRHGSGRRTEYVLLNKIEYEGQ
jgi:DNA-binding MarR family transcriptional regulator